MRSRSPPQRERSRSFSVSDRGGQAGEAIPSGELLQLSAARVRCYRGGGDHDAGKRRIIKCEHVAD